MAKDITQTRREKVVVHLDDAGGAMRLDVLHEWAGLKLLCAHQAFSQLMEGMVDDNLVRWDGTTFELLPDGRELAAQVRGAAGRAARPAPTAPAHPDHDHGHGHDHGHDHGAADDHGHDHGHDHDHGGGRPPAAAHDHGHDHDHGGGHDHDHDHGGGSTSGVRGGRTDARDARYGTGEEVDLDALRPKRPRPTPMRPPPPPVEPPGPTGLRASVKGALKKLLGR